MLGDVVPSHSLAPPFIIVDCSLWLVRLGWSSCMLPYFSSSVQCSKPLQGVSEIWPRQAFHRQHTPLFLLNPPPCVPTTWCLDRNFWSVDGQEGGQFYLSNNFSPPRWTHSFWFAHFLHFLQFLNLSCQKYSALSTPFTLFFVFFMCLGGTKFPHNLKETHQKIPA